MSKERSTNLLSFSVVIVSLYLIMGLIAPFATETSSNIISTDFGNAKSNSLISKFLTSDAESAKEISDATGIITEEVDPEAGKKLILADQEANSDNFIDNILAIFKTLKLFADLIGFAVTGGAILLIGLYAQTIGSIALQAIITLTFLPINIIFVYQIGKLVVGKGRL